MSTHARRWIGVLFAICLVSASIGGGTATATPDETIGASEDVEIDPDGVVIRIDVQPDGSAVWAIEHRVRLDDEETTQAFEDLRTDVEANRSAYVDRFEGRMNDTVGAARERTGREMRIENVSVTAETRTLPQEYGVLTYRFEWTGFAVVDGTAITAGDALAGFFLDSETRLLASWPDGYGLADVTPDPSERRDRTVVWNGPMDFGADEPRLVVDSSATGADGDGSNFAIGGGTLALVGAAVFLVGLAVGVLVWRRRDGSLPIGGASEPESDGTAPAEAPPSRDGAEEPTPAASAGSADGDSDDEPPLELLSNEEQVLRLLEDTGGRIKQQEVVQRLDWTDAKTSQVVGTLRDEGKVESFRLGRENVLLLPEAADEMDI